MRLACTLALAIAAPAFAQAPNVGTQQRGGTYHEPPAQVEPVYTPMGPNVPAQVAQHRPLRLQLALDVPLRSGGSANIGRGTQGSTAASPTLQATLRYRPWADAAWFAQATFYRYLRGDRQQPWHPDFSYAFGYDDPRPGSWSLAYANYTGTRFAPDRSQGEGFSNFRQGQWTLSRRFTLPEALEPGFLVGDGDAANCAVNLHLMPRFSRLAGGALGHWKRSASLGCRYTRPEGWYAEAAVFAWPSRAQQQPWDPDFSYGAGYESQSRYGTTALRYGNYSGNRFPGRARGAGEGTLRSGSLTLSWMREW